MNIDELRDIIEECELDNDKICVKNKIHDVIEFVKNNYSYKMLKSITAIDLSNEVELIYHLYSTVDDEDLLLSTRVQNETESISDIFDSAKADENEIYDMFGIIFTGNEDLKRLYMPENWEGFRSAKIIFKTIRG